MKPYCIKINLDKPSITFHYRGKPDEVIDRSLCFKRVNNEIEKHMPSKAAIDKMVADNLHAKKTQIENNLTIPETEKKKFLKELTSKEAKNKSRAQVVNRLHSELREKLGMSLLQDNIKRAVNDEWLKDALQLIKG